MPRGVLKPNVEVLESILRDCGRTAEETVYVGDSLMKDIAMAKEAGILDVHAKYGEPQMRPEYGLLQRVSHWKQQAVDREQALLTSDEIVPSEVLRESFAEILPIFDVSRVAP